MEELLNKLSAVKQRLHLNIKSGNVVIDTKDRDCLLSVIERLSEKEESK